MNNPILYLSRQDVERVNLEIQTMITLLETAFQEKGLGKTEAPPKPGIHPGEDSFLHAMLGYIPAMKSAGIKWVSAFPENPKRGLPYIAGLIILNNVDSGLPYAIMDATWITAYRTAGASALSAKYLARPESQSLGILGCGVQGKTHLEAMAALFDLEKVYTYDINDHVQQQYVKEMTEKTDLNIIPVNTPEEALQYSDLVVTAGPLLKQPHATIHSDWLQAGAFASAVDYDSYWSRAALNQVDKLATDDLKQMDFYRQKGYFQDMQEPYADLGEIAAGIKPGRTHSEERIIAMNLGLAIDDMAVAPEIYRRAKQAGIGTWLSL
ncbi:MAG: ornithine cyclodeaminase family protein [Anaerolineaceae bacterium]|nr:ornithine cyclodeaminase family protein [Anaerolineaceae bacterium]